MQQRGQLIELVRGTCGVSAHAPVIFVPHPSPQTQLLGMADHKCTETDALHASGDAPLACGIQKLRSTRPPGFIPESTSRTVLARTAGVNGLGSSVKPFSTTYFCTICRSS